MIANYHTHTVRCHHAKDTDEEYVLSAIANGLTQLGFSDHTPQWYPEDFCSKVRMLPEELDDYCRSVRELKEKYADRIDIRLGVEAEYYPACFSRLVEELKDHGVEYMILGQHWLNNEKGEPYCGKPTADEGRLRAYCDQTIAGMETGYFTYLAHPDLLRFEGEDSVYEPHIRRLCRAANANGVLLEINLHGIQTQRHYPTERFWRIAGEENCKVVLGSDAHQASDVYDSAAEQTALELVKKYGLDLQNTISLRDIRKL